MSRDQSLPFYCNIKAQCGRIAQLVQSAPGLEMAYPNIATELALVQAQNCINNNQPELMAHYARETLQHLPTLFLQCLQKKSDDCARRLILLVGVEAFLKTSAGEMLAQEFIKAAGFGEIKRCQALRNLVSELPLISAKTLNEAFVQAAFMGQLDVLKALKNEIAFKYVTGDGKSALSEAIKQFLELEKQSRLVCGNEELKAGFEENKGNAKAVIAFLMTHNGGLDVSLEPHRVALEQAADCASIELLTLLKPELTTFEKRVLWAAREKQTSWLNALIETEKVELSSSEMNALLITAMQEAISCDCQESVMYLLTIGVNPLASSLDEPSPFVVALNQGSTEVARELFVFLFQQGEVLPQDGLTEQGLKSFKSFQQEYQNEHPLIMLAQGKSGGSARTLIEKGIAVDTCDAQGKSALYYAVYYQNVALVEELLALGADPNFSKDGLESPLQLAAKKTPGTVTGVSATFRSLAEKATERSLTDLINQDSPDAVQYLLAKGFAIPMLDGKVDERVFSHLNVAMVIYTHSQLNGPGFSLNNLGQKGQRFLEEIKKTPNAYGVSPVVSALERMVQEGDLEKVKELVEQRGFDVAITDAKGYSPLHWAANRSFDNTAMIDYFLKKGLSVNLLANDGSRALHWAAKTGNLANAQALIEAGASLMDLDNYGMSPYLYALQKKHQALASYLYRETKRLGALVYFDLDIGLTSQHEQSHQEIAQTHRHTELELVSIIKTTNEEEVCDKIDASLARGANLNANSNSTTVHYNALTSAVILGKTNVVKHLLTKGASLTQRGPDGLSALHHAITAGEQEVSSLLIDKLFLQEGAGALYAYADWAIKENQVAILGTLLRKPGIDVDKANLPKRLQGTTLANLAASYGCFEALELLKELDANLDPPPNSRGFKPLHNALSAKSELQETKEINKVERLNKCIRLLYLQSQKPVLDHKRESNQENKPLHEVQQAFAKELIAAVRVGSVAEVEALLASGVYVDEKNAKGESALHAAVDGNNNELISLLLQAGANPNQKNSEGRTLLMMAIINGKEKAYNALLSWHERQVQNNEENKLEMSAADSSGHQALHYAVSSGNMSLVLRLIKKFGAWNNAQNRQGVGVLQLAGDNTQLVELLLRAGTNKHLRNCSGKSAVDLAMSENKHYLSEVFAYAEIKTKQSREEYGQASYYQFRELCFRVKAWRLHCLRAYLKGASTYQELQDYSFVRMADVKLTEQIKGFIFKEMMELFAKANEKNSAFRDRLNLITENFDKSEESLVFDLSDLEKDIREEHYKTFRAEVVNSRVLAESSRMFRVPNDTQQYIKLNDEKKETLRRVLFDYKLDFSRADQRHYWQQGTGQAYTIERSGEVIKIPKTIHQIVCTIERFKNKGTYAGFKSSIQSIVAQARNRKSLLGRAEEVDELLARLEGLDGLLKTKADVYGYAC